MKQKKEQNDAYRTPTWVLHTVVVPGVHEQYSEYS